MHARRRESCVKLGALILHFLVHFFYVNNEINILETVLISQTTVKDIGPEYLGGSTVGNVFPKGQAANDGNTGI